MTNLEITQEYMKGRRLRVVSGKTDNLMVVLPFLIMDLQHDLYTKTIKPLPCRFKAKQLQSKWQTDYTKFNREMFSVLGDEARDYLISKMDDYEEYIHNYIEMLRIELINAFEKLGVDENKHQVLSVVITCNTLIQAASVVWRKIYVNVPLRGESLLTSLEKTTMDFIDVYYKDEQDISLNSFDGVTKAMNLLCKKLISWVGNN